ncbi:MAG: SUMF1/EgtB/PvdO family nonheme iron enzyme [Gallionella sp.]
MASFSFSARPLLLLPLMLLGINVAFAESERPARYQHSIQAAESCESCHARNQVDVFTSNMASDCNECHSSGESDFIAKVAEKGFDDPYVNKTEYDAPAEATAGMSVPMLYDETRIGKEPNKMIAIPAGKYIRGSDDRLPDEGPRYDAETDAFLIDVHEVTNLQYKQFINATNRRSPKHFRNRTYPTGKVDHPVVWVSWNDAHDYCEWAGKRLPTDIEWEKAARGTDGRDYPWGNDFDLTRVNSPVRWDTLGIEGDTLPVGSFEGGKSPYGLYDTSGNVWEWTESWYTQYPDNQWPSENYGEIYKVLKGGSWWDCSFYQCGVSAPVFNRSYFKKNIKNTSFGFRCAKNDK